MARIYHMFIPELTNGEEKGIGVAGLAKLEYIPWNYQLGWGSFPEMLKGWRKVISE